MSVALSNDHPPLPITLSGNGPQPMASSMSVTMANNQSPIPVNFNGSGPEPMSSSMSVTLASNQTPIPVTFSANGQQNMAGSLSVALASNQTPVPVSLSGSGAQPMANSTSVTLASNQTAVPVAIAATGVQNSAASLAVTIASDQSPISIAESASAIVSGSITTNGQRITAPMAQFNGASISLSGTYAGVNLTFEASYNGGITYIAINAVSVSGNTVLATTGSLTNAANAYKVYCPGSTHISVRATSWTSGSANLRIAPYVVAMDPNPVISGALNANQSVNNAQWGGSNSLNGGTAGSVGIGGLAADSAAASGNPVQTGGRVRTAADTTLAANDAMALTGTSGMQLLVKPYGLPETDWQFNALLSTATASAARAAGAAGVRNYVTAIQYQNTSATASEIQIQDGATVIWRAQAPAAMALPAMISFPTPLRGTAATALNVQLITTATSTFVNLQGYQAA
jgi:hypothetical protein